MGHFSARIVKPLGNQWLVASNDSWVESLSRLTDSEMVGQASTDALSSYERDYTPANNLRELEKAYALAAETGNLAKPAN